MLESSALNINYKNDLVYITFREFEKYSFISHAFSTRLGGVSTDIYSSLNLGFKRGDDYKNVYENYKILCSAININQDDIVFGQLTHNNNVRKVTAIDRGKGIIKPLDYTDIDALITNEDNIPLAMTFADCVPIFFLEPINKVIAIAHSGWRGTVKQIGKKVVEIMENDYNCNLKNIIIGIAPSIGGCCFEVDKEVYLQFENMDCLPNNWFEKSVPNKYNINMWSIIKNMFVKMGIPNDNIIVTDLCTKCNCNVFFSHRATNGKRGSMAGVIAKH